MKERKKLSPMLKGFIIVSTLTALVGVALVGTITYMNNETSMEMTNSDM